MSNRRERPRARSAALRDLLVILLAVVVLVWAGSTTGVFGEIRSGLHGQLAGRRAEVLATLVLVALGLTVFSVRLWLAARREQGARHEAEGRFRSLVEKLPGVIYTWDPRKPLGTGMAPYVGPRVEQVLGFSAEEWIADPELLIRQLHPDDREGVIEAFQRTERAGEPLAIEHRHRKKDGSIVWIRNEAVVIEHDVRGRPSLVQGVMFDVTQRKHAEGHLAEAEARYRTLVERVPAVTYTWDSAHLSGEAPAPYISPQVRALLGYGPEEFADPKLWTRLVHPDDIDRVMAEWAACQRGDVAFRSEYRLLAKDDRLVWVRDEAVPVSRDDHGHALFQGVMFDITERKLAEGRLQEAEERFRTLVEQIPAITFLQEYGSERILYISPQIEGVLGYTPKEWSADPTLWERTLHPEDSDQVLRESAAGGNDTWSASYRAIARDGRVVWLQNHAQLLRDEDGQPRYWQGVGFDITELKDAETRILEAESTYKTLVEQLPVVVYQDAIDDLSTALYISPAYERFFGFKPEVRLQDPHFWVDHLHPDDRDRVLELSLWTNETGEPFSAEYRFLAQDGNYVWVRDEAVLLPDADGRPALWQGVLIDITARKHAEEVLSNRDAVLQAVGLAAERFLNTPSWRGVLEEVLERFGTAARASRAYVFCNRTDEDGQLRMSAVAEWCAPGIEPTIDDPKNQDYPYARGFEWWVTEMQAGHAAQTTVSQAQGEERADLQAEGVRSLLAVPVFVAGDWWGFLGLDDCETERLWPPAEVEALKAAADILGAAIGRTQAEQQRVEAEERYRTLVERLPGATYIDRVDEDSTTVYVSPQVESLFGYRPEEWIADADVWKDALHPEDRDRVLEAARRHNTEGASFELEYRMRTKDDRWVWVSDIATVVRDREGVIRFSQGVMFDITERREAGDQLREAEDRYRAIVEHIPAAIYVDRPDDQMQSLYVSPQIEQITGWTSEEFIANPELWLDAMREDYRDEVRRSYLEALRNRQPWKGEYPITTPDGREVWIHDETSIVTGDDGNLRFLQGVLYDVTERKHAEQALRESEQREREAAERLRALDEMKNTFLAAVSHELRSPLTSILGLALTLEHQSFPVDEQTDLLGRLAANARKLDQLLKDLLDIDRLSRGIVSPKVRAIDIGEVVQRTVESLDVLGERAIEILAAPVVVDADAPKVERIVENLVVNAIRHTEPDVRIWVRAYPEDGGAMIVVEDDGPGIPDALRDEIFEPFRQGPTASPHSPGTGIGLSLVSMFAELHGGRAWVQDRDGGGASFRVFLPEGDEATGSNGEPRARPASVRASGR